MEVGGSGKFTVEAEAAILNLMEAAISIFVEAEVAISILVKAEVAAGVAIYIAASASTHSETRIGSCSKQKQGHQTKVACAWLI